MTRPRRSHLLFAGAALLVVSALGSGVAVGCGPWLTFRAYLRSNFWQPVRHMSKRLAASAPRGGGTAAYAGLSDESAPKALADLRAAYLKIASGFVGDDEVARVNEAERAVKAALVPGVLEGASLEEARLIEAKVAMRAMDADVGTADVARRKFEAFLASNATPAHASEARAWLARILNAQGDAVGAVRIYFEELDRPSPVVPATALANSVRMVFVAHQDQFWERADAFFDTPAHALFIINLLTNPQSRWDDPIPESTRQKNGARVLGVLRAKKSLFQPGPDSDALDMALMRASLFSGDVAGALRDSQAIAESSPLRQDPEFCWMLASAFYLSGEHAKAEAPLVKMLDAPGATAADRRTAAQALVAVYLKTGRPVDALHASLVQASVKEDESITFDSSSRPQWCVACDSLDLPYLLDATLTEEELAAYLKKHPDPIGLPIPVFRDGSRQMPAPDLVRYSLAVRWTRRGNYSEAERMYTKLGIRWRAARMRTLSILASRARNGSQPAADRLQARYDLAAYLADNPERILFNDLLWKGFQREALLSAGWDPRDDRESGMTADEHDAVVTGDRRLRDEQEERWQAFLRLEQVVSDAGNSPLARTAVRKILDCLPRINTERFGREAEISAAIQRWLAWLRAHPVK
jgi:hypothetical protein